MKNFFPYLLLVAGLAACHHNDPDVQPVSPAATANTQAANYDILANANGHWQWESHNYWFKPRKDSAAIGYGRQLIFKNDSTLLLRRTGQPDYKTTFTFAAYSGMCQTHRPQRVTFTTGETLLPGNIYRDYQISSATGAQPRILQFTQDGFCLDANAVERYHWVTEP